MKQTFFFLFISLGLSLNAQMTSVNLSMQPGYSDRVYYQFSNNTSQSFPAESWDLAFLRTSSMAIGTRVNPNIEVYEASNNPSDWNSIDPSNIGSWTQLYNSDTTWEVGAIDNGSATYGWGEYNVGNHHVEGTVIFVLKYPDDSMKKFMIEDFFGGYTIKYADWNEATSTWETDETYTLTNSTNPDHMFNYFSLQTDAEVNASPTLQTWDIVFLQYLTDVGGGMMYPVTGVFHNPEVSVAKNVEPNGTPDTSNLTFSDDINTIGYEWKNFNGTAYDIETDTYYYVKYSDGTVYRFHFTSFDGSSTGNLTLEYEEVTNLMSTVVFDKENSFSIFPNPSSDGRVEILYKNQTRENANVAVYALTGKKVFQTQLKNEGFYNQVLDLSDLASGVYLIKFQSGDFSTTEKIILN
ncbi:MAG TPA: T9SS type A sorting domain-containing protein [Flavobacteriaceae bacterium]|nr:T9SS type A sorting domain-containing protein [Flavobacteriaceae bacterium]